MSDGLPVVGLLPRAQPKRLPRVTAPAILEVQITAEGPPPIVTGRAGVVADGEVL